MIEQPDAEGGDDDSIVKLLEGLRPLEISDNEAGVVTGIARFAQSVRVLELVATTAKWYTRWEIREALAQNARTLDRVRDTIGTGLAIIDLMREMDSRRLSDDERNEIRDDIRSLLKTLPSVDREVVKAYARALAAGPKAPAIDAPPPVISAEQQAADEAAVRDAGQINSADALLAALGDDREQVRRAATANPALSEPLLLEAVRLSSHPDFLHEVATHPRWSYVDLVRRAVIDHPLVPTTLHTQLDQTARALLAFMRYFNEPMEPADKASFAKDLLADVQALPAPEREFIRYRIGEHWGPFIREVMRSIEDEFKRAQPVPVSTAWPEARPPEALDERPLGSRAVHRNVAPAPAPMPTIERTHADAPAASFDAERHVVEPMHPRPPSTEANQTLAARSIEDRIEIATATTNRDELAFLLHDHDDRVFGALLNNPAFGEEEIVASARHASRERIRRLVDCKRSWALLAVKIALLHNPHCPEAVMLDCLNHVSAMRELQLVMRDSRVRSLEVKAKARGRIVERWRVMSSDERVSAIKQSGGDLLHDLWNEAFGDERTLLRLLQDRSLDEGVVLKIVRSRIAPREVLGTIGRDPGWANNYQIRLELALNPKTPREVVAKLVPKLSAADRARLKASGQGSDFMRDMA